MNIDTCPLFSNWSRAMRGLSAPYAQRARPRGVSGLPGASLCALSHKGSAACAGRYIGLRVLAVIRRRRPAEAGGGASCLHRNELQDWELTAWLTD